MLKFCAQIHFDKKLIPCETAAKRVKHTADDDCVTLYIKTPTPPIWSFRLEEDSIGDVMLHQQACSSPQTITQSFFSTPDPEGEDTTILQAASNYSPSVTHQNIWTFHTTTCQNLKSHAF